jgi:hypothetical protein
MKPAKARPLCRDTPTPRHYLNLARSGPVVITNFIAAAAVIIVAGAYGERGLYVFLGVIGGMLFVTIAWLLLRGR